MRVLFDKLAAHREPGAQGVERLAADRHDTAAVAFAQHLDFGGIQLEPAGRAVAVGVRKTGIEPDQFGQTQTGRIEQFENRVIAQPFSGTGGGRFHQAVGVVN